MIGFTATVNPDLALPWAKKLTFILFMVTNGTAMVLLTGGGYSMAIAYSPKLTPFSREQR
jgi:hypothetical protein